MTTVDDAVSDSAASVPLASSPDLSAFPVLWRPLLLLLLLLLLLQALTSHCDAEGGGEAVCPLSAFTRPSASGLETSVVGSMDAGTQKLEHDFIHRLTGDDDRLSAALCRCVSSAAHRSTSA